MEYIQGVHPGGSRVEDCVGLCRVEAGPEVGLETGTAAEPPEQGLTAPS